MAVAEAVVLRLDSAQLVRQLTAETRLQCKLEVAHDLQQCLLPSSPPRLPGFGSGRGLLSGQCVGGDYYDFLSPRCPTGWQSPSVMSLGMRFHRG
jgi:serine phosphatase RsbU (regulator of sigma subunit)